MGLFSNKYPCTDFHELNLDWIILKIHELGVKIDDWTIANELKFANPILWDKSNFYDKHTIVLSQEQNTYLSLRDVPAGVKLTDKRYWFEIGYYDAKLLLYPTTYTTVSDMKAAAIKDGQTIVRTLGYYTVNDGGGADYYITNIEPDGIYETLDNGLYAKLIIEDDTVNIKQVGAVGDGLTDDTDMIQKALDNVNTVLITKSVGSYVITSLHINSYNRLLGESGVLEYKKNTAVDGSVLYYIIECFGSHDFEIANIILNGNQNYNRAFAVCDGITFGGNNSSVHDNYLYDIPDSGIMFSGGKSARCDNNVIDNCTDCGLYVNSGTLDNMRDCTIIGNKISNCLASGIACKRYNNKIVISENIIHDSTFGITLEQASSSEDYCTQTSINNNFIYNVNRSCINIRGGKNHTIVGNTIINCVNTPISVDGCSNVTITGNSIETSDTDASATYNVVFQLSCRSNALNNENITIGNNTVTIKNNLRCVYIGVSGLNGVYKNIVITGNVFNGVAANIVSIISSSILKNCIFANNAVNSRVEGYYADSAVHQELYQYNNIGSIKLRGTVPSPAIFLQVQRDEGDVTQAIRLLNPVRSESARNNATYKKGDIIPQLVSTGTVLYYASDDGIGRDVLKALASVN